MKILEIAIGLSFVYILFSLICTTLTEAIARVASLRARTLKGAIRHMIDDGTTVNVDVLYESPFIRNLSKKSWLIRKARPSYISSRTFALALYDTLLEAKPHSPRAVEVAEDDSPVDVQAKVDAYIESLQRDQQQRVENEVLVQQDAEARNQLKQLITSTIPADHPERDKWLNLLAPVTDESLALQNKARDRFLELRSAVSKMEPPDSQFQKGLLRILDNAEMEAKDYDTALANARLGMELWFDDTMSRVTGWYARNTRTIVVILALFITIGFNIDTFAITRALWAEDTIRQSIVEQADKFIRPIEQADLQGDNAPKGETVQSTSADAVDNDKTGDNAVAGEDVAVEAPLAASDAPPIDDGQSYTYTLDMLLTEVDKIGVPIGWVVVVTESEPVTGPVDLFGWATVRLESGNVEHQAEILKAERYSQQWPRTTSLWGTKLAGLFVTWVALSLGAPFWFDLLNMFVNMRAAGKKPDVVDVVRVGESNLNDG